MLRCASNYNQQNSLRKHLNFSFDIKGKFKIILITIFKISTKHILGGAKYLE